MIFVKSLEFFTGKRAKVQLPKFYHIHPCGSPYNAIEIFTLTLRILGKLFWGWEAPGILGQKCMGWPQT